MFFGRALQAAPNETRYKIGFARSLHDLRLKKPDPALVAMVLPLLGAPGVEPRDLSPVIESAICLDPVFSALNPLDFLPGPVIGAADAKGAARSAMRRNMRAVTFWRPSSSFARSSRPVASGTGEATAQIGKAEVTMR